MGRALQHSGSTMLNLVPPNAAERLRALFRDAGYTEGNLVQLGFRDLASTRLRNSARLLDRTRESTCLNTLLRWFWIGMPEPPQRGESLTSEFEQLLLASGLLCEQDGQLTPQAMLMETNGFLIASDHTSMIDRGDSELVLWPNPTSRLLLRMTIRRPSRATLDLGTGTGIQALAAASHSETVVATDLSPRAVKFAAFNARLNGVGNVECVVGGGFDPVVGRKFDLIVSNPPFFISPSAHYLFCDSAMELDELCRRLAKQAPDFLNEDGYFQMLCEWAQVQGQPWQERITEWLGESGCDAWVMKGYSQDPAEYAEQRIRATVSSPNRDAQLYDEYMAYYRQRHVEAIDGGAIVMHRRSGHNWIQMEEISQTPKDPFGEAIVATFAARDFLLAHSSDDQLLTMKPKLSPDARLEQILQQEGAQWKRTALTLKLAKGFPFSLGLQPLVAEFLSAGDGSRTLAELIEALASKVPVPGEQVQRECLDVMRKLIERGFVTW